MYRRLRDLREDADLTQRELAEYLNCTQVSYSHYELGKRDIPTDVLIRLADFYGTSTDYLLGLSDERNNVEQVFYNDRGNFERHFKAMSAELRPVVAKCFDSFYLLLGRDMQLSRPERLQVYQELFQTLQSLRAGIRKAVEASGGAITDPLALSELMAMQSQLKNEVCALLDKLMQADMEIAFRLKKDAGAGSSEKSAM